MTVPFILVGIALLLWGKRLFWLLVGALGFLVGWYMATHYLEVHPQSMLMLISFVPGIACALLAFFLQKIAIRAVGFLVAGLFAVNLSESFGWNPEHFPWPIFLIGGVIGAILASFVFEWVLIVASSLTGAYLITRELQMTSHNVMIVIVVLASIGIVFQLRRPEKSQPARGA